MRTFGYAIHIIAGSLGIITGFVALYAAKGGPLHRRLGMVFVYAMLTTAVAGGLIAAVLGVAPSINLPASVMTAYLVVTALMTVRPPFPGSRPLAVGLMLVALTVGGINLAWGFEAVALGGEQAGFAFPYLMFGTVGLLGGASDLKVIRSEALRGSARIARHLWRMCFALFIAALSFFIGQAKVFPEPIRIRPLLALPVLVVLVTMFYWLWRVRIKRSLRGIVALGPSEAV
jgi:uncharacterized membrane protein